MTGDARDLALVDDLRKLPAETAWAEFKENNADPKTIGKLISAISNSARLDDRKQGYVLWGVRNGDRAIVGTRFDPGAATCRRQPLEFWLAQMLRPDVAFSFRTVRRPEGRVVLLEIPAAATSPVDFDKAAYIRIGSATPRLADYPERRKALWSKLGPHAWETGIARAFVDADEVIDLLDCRSYFALTGQPEPERREAVLARLEDDRLISRDAGNRWNVHNLGAILFAVDLDRFGSGLARKALRFVRYDGDDRAATVIHRRGFPRGYASGFHEVNDYVNALVPAPEHLASGVRIARPMFPPVAVRELAANALVHQDMTVTGAGPTVELFANRMEIANPGAPLVAPERFIESSPRSRNEGLAALMRRMSLCEELGTGIDKAVTAVEADRLPPPEFRAEAESTRAILFGPRRFADMTAQERLRACRQHAVLRYLDGGRRMRNADLRERFGLDNRNANTVQISQIIRQALDGGLIRVADPRRPRAGYLPADM